MPRPPFSPTPKTPGSETPESSRPETDRPRPEEPRPEEARPEETRPDALRPQDPRPHDPHPQDPRPKIPQPGGAAPGVYVSAGARGPAPIAGVETGTAAFLGETERGPLRPRLVTSHREYARLYGGEFAEDRYLPSAARAFFQNGGRRLFVARVMGRGGARPGLAEFAGRHDEAGRPIMQAEELRGLAALAQPEFREASLIHAPGIDNDEGGLAIQELIVAHCEEQGDRFAILDAAPCLSALDDPRLDPRLMLNGGRGSRHAAFYHPWLWVQDSPARPRRLVPPGGFVCGVYARNDESRGVWKAPANLPVEGALALEAPVGRVALEVLAPRGVNCLRHLPGRGLRVWGARTLAREAPWHYVPVQRYRMFLAASLREGLRWAAFEPNSERLWARVRQSAAAFLRNQWRNGALIGATEEEAFLVKVGRETMTKEDLNLGRLNLEIAVAPLRPAEFITFRIGLKTGDSV